MVSIIWVFLCDNIYGMTKRNYINKEKKTILISILVFVVCLFITVFVIASGKFPYTSLYISNKYIVLLCAAIVLFLTYNNLKSENERKFVILCFLLVLHSIVKFVDEEVLIAELFDLSIGSIYRFIKITFDYLDHLISVGVCLSLYSAVSETISKKRNIIIFVFFAIYYLTIFTRFCITKCYDEQCVGHNGPGMYIAYAFYILFALRFFSLLLVNYNVFGTKRIIASVFYSISLGLICTNQAFHIDTIDIDSLMSIDALIVYFIMHTNDSLLLEYEEQIKINNMKDKLLLSQIKPHFLFNTLTTIKVLYREEPELGESTLIDLAEYLKGLFSSIDNDRLVSFEDEIENIKHYTNIEKMRFENLKVEYDINDTDFEVPPLSIQPIVENAIKHGLRNKVNGVVKISSYLDGTDHVVVVKDNGEGFEVKRDNYDRTQIGVNNVKNRLSSIVCAKVDIDSTIGKGTCVTIRIPNTGLKK